MDITRKNYEAYFIDYLEGNLDAKLVNSFLEFLQKNSDLKEELMLFETIEAVPENTSFAKKDQLYKEKYDQENEFNKAAVANLEGDISGKEKREFENYLSLHPEKQKEVKIFNKTVLQADKNIHFEQKQKLYKKTSRKLVLLWTGRVAAVFILAFAIFSLMNRNNESVVPKNQMAQAKQNTSIVEDIQREEVSTPVVKTEPEPIKKHATKPIKKEVIPPSKKATKSIRENTKGRLEEEGITRLRIPVKTMTKINTITASLDVQSPHADLGIMTLVYPDLDRNDEHLLADNLKGKLSLQKISKAGLNFVTSISNERFTYETNDEGKVIEYNYESRLLAFSIPSTKPESK